MVVAKQQLLKWRYISELWRQRMQLVGRHIQKNQIWQVSNIGRQTDELVVAQVELRQVTKMPEWRAQIHDTPCIKKIYYPNAACNMKSNKNTNTFLSPSPYTVHCKSHVAFSPTNSQ